MHNIPPYFSKFLGLALLVFTAVFFAGPAFAASISFEGPGAISQGQDVLVNAFLDTNGDSVNALQGSMTFPNNVMQLQEVRAGNSIVNFWITQPAVNQSGKVDFSGIIPGGYNNKKGFLFSLVFKTVAQGSGVISVDGLQILKNDGKGTALSATVIPFAFSVGAGESAPPSLVEPVQDTTPPEHFTPELAQSPDLFDGKWFLTFATQDKDSGIAYYQVREGAWGNFTTQQSPYLLQNQNLDQEIFIKAVDNNGNETTEIFYPPNFKPWYQHFNLWILLAIIFIVFCVIMIVIGGLVWKYSKK